ISARIAAKGDDTAAQLKLAKAKKSAMLAGVAGLTFLPLSVLVLVINMKEIRGDELLTTTGVAGQGRIDRRFIAPNGVTARLEYKITTPDGKTGTHNAEVERFYWQSLEGAKTVPVIYAKNEPEFSRLATGEIESSDSMKQPMIGYG